MIFNKIIDNEIDKAIILRDGKPGFLLMDFHKYEQIMAEFEELKNNSLKKQKNISNKNKISKSSKKIENITKSNKVKKHKKKEVIQTSKEIIKKEIDKNLKVKPSIQSAHIVPPRPKILPVIPESKKIEEPQILEEKNTKDELTEPIIKQKEEIKITNTTKQEESQEDEELQKALDSIKSMNFDDNMRVMAEQKIKEKILKARESRAKQIAQQEANQEQEEEEELEFQHYIEEEKKKKEQELKEFWD